jgi:predicted nucleic acid-binding protein
VGRRRRAPLSDLPAVASLLLDAGAVLAIVRDKQQVRRWIEHADGLGVDPAVSLVTVAEVFRDRPAAARVQWVLSRLDKEPVTLGHAWDAGRLLGHSGGRGMTVDAIVAATALRMAKPVALLTSDPGDLERLLEGYRGVYVAEV